jgi:5,10-methylenetetrahydromethanopterin reductase
VPRKSPRAIREAITLIRALLRGEQVDMHGDVIFFLEGRLGFKPRRAEIPIHVTSNGPVRWPMGQSWRPAVPCRKCSRSAQRWSTVRKLLGAPCMRCA